MVQHGNLETFNDLIRAHSDRTAAYEKAALSLKPQESGLSTLFSEIIKESHQCIAEINSRLIPEGEIPEEHLSLAGKIYKVWADVNVTFSSNPNYSLLDICEKYEDAMVKAYQEALHHTGTLTSSDITLLEAQREVVRKTHNVIKNKRDQYRELVRNNQII